MELKGNIGSSPIGYDFTVDGSLNVQASIGYTEPTTQAQAGGFIKAPAATVLSMLASKISSNPVMSSAETILVQAIEAYVIAHPAPAAAAQ